MSTADAKLPEAPKIGGRPPRLLVVRAPYYTQIVDGLRDGAVGSARRRWWGGSNSGDSNSGRSSSEKAADVVLGVGLVVPRASVAPRQARRAKRRRRLKARVLIGCTPTIP